VVHYVNQFFGGIGGEDMAHVGVSLADGVVGASRALQQALGDRGTLVGTLIGGDNYVSEQRHAAMTAISEQLRNLQPDAVIAGPAFNAGRYGLACAEVCKTAQALGVPAVTGMHPENPGTLCYPAEVLIVPTGATSVDMPAALEAMVRLAVKLGHGETLGPAQAEGYLPRGIRRVYDRQRLGYLRALEMLQAKLALVPDFPCELKTLLEHMIISHHGEYEFGSPKLPMFPEALLLHYLDDLDSKMESMRALFEREAEVENAWTSYSPSLGRPLLNTAKFLATKPVAIAETVVEASASALTETLPLSGLDLSGDGEPTPVLQPPVKT